jgi:hypothetical protein
VIGDAAMARLGMKLATVSVALVTTCALTAVPTVQPLPHHTVPAVRLAAASVPAAAESVAPQTNILGALFSLDLGRFILPPSWGQPFPEPDFGPPTAEPTDFAGAIKNTYVALEPWVHYGFQIAQYAVGWIPYVGWLSPQIDIFYHFGERIVRSIVFNSADWLWGPLPFVDGLRNIAQDSWNALVQLGRDQWNFWLPPLPPLPPLPSSTDDAPAEPLAARVGTVQEFSPPLTAPVIGVEQTTGSVIADDDPPQQVGEVEPASVPETTAEEKTSPAADDVELLTTQDQPAGDEVAGADSAEDPPADELSPEDDPDVVDVKTDLSDDELSPTDEVSSDPTESSAVSSPTAAPDRLNEPANAGAVSSTGPAAAAASTESSD